MKVTRTALAGEPITLAAMKNFLRVDHTADDALITQLIIGARKLLEARLNVSIIPHEVVLVWPDYEPIQPVPYGPVIEWEELNIDGLAADEPDDSVFRMAAGDMEALYTAGFEEVPEDITDAIRKIVQTNYTGEGMNIFEIMKYVEHHSRQLWL